MLTAVVLAIAVAAGAPWLLVGAVALAVLHPVWLLVSVAVWAAVRRLPGNRGSDEGESAFLRGLAAELSAGASLRGAVVAAAGRAPDLPLERAARLCAAGRPADEIGPAVGKALSVNGPAAAAAFRLAGSAGGSIAPVFDRLAARAESEGRLVRDRASLTAQARLSAWLVGGAPIALLGIGLATGVGPAAGDIGSGGRAMVSIGIGLIALGSLAVVLMVRRAGR